MSPTTSQPRNTASPGADTQRQANDQLWGQTGLVHTYATRDLRPAEVIILVRYRDELTGRVLELGCGAGRLTGYLSEIAQIAHGIDISPEMVAYCRQAYPAATFSQGDLRDVGAMGRASFDAVFATFNVLDVLSDDERGQVLESIHNVLPAGGLLIMSSHNLAYAPHIGDALHVRYQGLVGTAYHLLQIPRWRRNRRRLLPLERVEPGYSILNDISHDFLALHYYIAPEEQRLQLEEHGFDLIECLDLDGRRLEPGMTAPECPELQYVARRRADGEIATAQ